MIEFNNEPTKVEFNFAEVEFVGVFWVVDRMGEKDPIRLIEIDAYERYLNRERSND